MRRKRTRKQEEGSKDDYKGGTKMIAGTKNKKRFTILNKID